MYSERYNNQKFKIIVDHFSFLTHKKTLLEFNKSKLF